MRDDEMKFVTGETSTLGFVRIMKAKGITVSPEFPAETLREQIDSLDERDITFLSPNESVVAAVNDEEPGPTGDVSLTFVAEGISSGETPYLDCRIVSTPEGGE